MKTLILDFFPVIHPDGRVVKTEGKFEEICEHVGSPFDSATLIPGKLGAFVDDEGIIKELPLNVPVLLATGFVFAGPVMLIGPADDEGNTTFPNVPEVMWRALANTCVTLFTAKRKLDGIRANPGPTVIPLTEENLQKLLAGEFDG